jgi:predicted nucleic acid-binding protein
LKKLYIETSVWNQLEHDDRPDWKETAERFMATLKKGIYEPYISYVVVREIEATKDAVRRTRLVEHVNSISPIILEADEEVEALTELYMSSEFVNTDSLRVYNDCSHVAVATVNGIRHIVSYNCKHLVNDRRIDGFNGINFKNGYDNIIDITTPHRFVLADEQE